jgi:hypothetical protein
MFAGLVSFPARSSALKAWPWLLRANPGLANAHVRRITATIGTDHCSFECRVHSRERRAYRRPGCESVPTTIQTAVLPCRALPRVCLQLTEEIAC